MNSSFFKSKLGLKFIGVSALAFVVALFLMVLIYEGFWSFCFSNAAFEHYWQRERTATVERFQQYVDENQLTIQETVQDLKWGKRHRAVELYFSDKSELVLSEEYEDTLETITGTPIFCADGMVYVFVFPSAVYFDSIGIVIALLSAVSCFFLILIPFVCQIIKRITRLCDEMQILSGGELSYQVVSYGTDELAELGRSIEAMRRAVLEQMEKENAAVLANSRLITSLSHDLRTPLTKLTGYLEILKYKKYKNEKEKMLYLERAIDKAEQMRHLSDEMFRHFQVEHAVSEKEAVELVSGPMLLLQMLSEQCYDLQEIGFQIQLPSLEGNYALQVQIEDLRRILDNLFSNLKKYADMQFPVVFSVQKRETEIVMIVENHIGAQTSSDSRGIGLPTMHALLRQNGGRMETEQTGNLFYTQIYLPTVAYVQ